MVLSERDIFRISIITGRKGRAEEVQRVPLYAGVVMENRGLRVSARKNLLGGGTIRKHKFAKKRGFVF